MKQKFLEKLDKILMSNNAVSDFHSAYNGDIDFKNWLDETIPYIQMCKNQQQNNPWHKYNVLDHILHSVEEINKQTRFLPERDRRMLAYCMLFHDIGKPEKHITRQKNGQTIDSFFDHNIRSAEICQEILPNLGFDKDETTIMTKLVFKHDIFMFIKEEKTNNPYWKVLSPTLAKEEIEDLNSVGDGKKLLQYLIMIGRADNLAQNEKMTASSLKMLDKFDSILDKIISDTSREL